jgi:hypothetical protein
MICWTRFRGWSRELYVANSGAVCGEGWPVWEAVGRRSQELSPAGGANQGLMTVANSGRGNKAIDTKPTQTFLTS